MPRRMGELRRLNIEWNRLTEAARERGIYHVDVPEVGRQFRVQPRAHFQISRVEARARVARLRDVVAPFFAPDLSTGSTAGVDTFGIEIELMLPRNLTSNGLAEKIRQAGVMCNEERGSTIHATRTYWKIVGDGSLRSYNGRELVSPPLSGEEGFAQIRKVGQVLTANNCKVNLRCGFHVHVGIARHSVDTWRRVFKIFKKWEPAIDSFMAPSRRGNGYCGSLLMLDPHRFATATTLNDLRSAVGQSTNDPRSPQRYRKVNFLAMLQHRTVEFRQHQGTVDSQKMEMWVKFILRCVAKSESEYGSLDDQPSNLFSLLSFVGCTETEKNFFNGRAQYFSTHSNVRGRHD